MWCEFRFVSAAEIYPLKIYLAACIEISCQLQARGLDSERLN